MPNLNTIEIKAFVPSKDFELSKRFYADLGFSTGWTTDDMACLYVGKTSFILQKFYRQEHADNFMMHLLVEDADAWWAHLQAREIASRYGVRAEPPEDRPWGMRDFVLIDPAGVLWRIGQDIENKP